MLKRFCNIICFYQHINVHILMYVLWWIFVNLIEWKSVLYLFIANSEIFILSVFYLYFYKWYLPVLWKTALYFFFAFNRTRVVVGVGGFFTTFHLYRICRLTIARQRYFFFHLNPEKMAKCKNWPKANYSPDTFVPYISV